MVFNFCSFIIIICILFSNSVQIYGQEVNNIVACNDTTFLQATFEGCMNSTTCKDKFILSGSNEDDITFFNFLILEELEHNIRISITDLCKNNDTFSLWISILEFYPLCSANEVLDPDQGCICKADKECIIMDSTEFGVTSIVVLILAIITIILIVYFSVVVLNKLSAIQKKLLKQKKDGELAFSISDAPHQTLASTLRRK